MHRLYTQLLEEKVASRYKSVREAFIRFDSDCDGMIGANELRFQCECGPTEFLLFLFGDVELCSLLL